MTRSKGGEAGRSLIPSLAVDFANTVACPGCRGGDALASPEAARRWIRSRVPRGRTRVDREDLKKLREFRSDLRKLFDAAVDRARPVPAAIATVNRAAARAPPRSLLRWTPGRWVAEEAEDDGTAAQRLMALSARSAILQLGSHRPLKVRRCQGPGCIHFLVVRRSQQRWCSPTGCGNRARVQRHYRKLRTRLDGR